jgi:transcriptional regulator with XRE-family HTH domain
MSEAARSPTAVRRELGQRLRAMRTGADLTVAEAAERVGISTSKLTKIELAQLSASRDDVLKLLDTYGEAGPEQQALLLTMVREGNRKEWWEGRRALHPKFGSYLGLESVATTLQAYDTHLVHGLLQTPDYARAQIRAARPELLEHEIDQLVQFRLRRQEVLTRDDPPPLTLWSVMDEAVLRRHVGGRETMHAQLQRLITASERPNVTLLVMPDELGAHPGLDGPLSILQFETGTRPVAYVEGQAGNLYMEKDDDLRRCQQTMNHILAAAPGPEQSLALIRQIAKEIKP